MVYSICHIWNKSTQPLNLETDILHIAAVWLSMKNYSELILEVKYLFFQLPLVHNDNRNAWCFKNIIWYMNIWRDEYMNIWYMNIWYMIYEVFLPTFLVSTTLLSMIVLIAEDLLKYGLCSWPNQNKQNFFQKKV